MAQITLHNNSDVSATYVSNNFIDYYMTAANGEYVKIYLYLLRCMNAADCSFSLSSVADKFEHTEKDVQRALVYWEKMKLLRLEYDTEKKLSGIYFLDSKAPDTANPSEQNVPLPETSAPDMQFSTQNLIPRQMGSQASALQPNPMQNANITEPQNPMQNANNTAQQNFMQNANNTVQQNFMQNANNTAQQNSMQNANATAQQPAENPPEAAKHNYTAAELAAFQEKDAVRELLFVTEHYLKRPLTPTDMNTILFWYDELAFPVDLIEYLVEYCLGKGHTSLRYMEKVALAWKKEGVNTVERAKCTSSSFRQIHFSVMRALGISGRNLVPAETAFIDKWSKTYGFTPDIITEACRRTIAATHQPSFEYTDGILDRWHKQNIHHLSDIVKLDSDYQNTKKSAAVGNKAAAPNKFHNFNQRTYDYGKLEQQLLNSPKNQEVTCP